MTVAILHNRPFLKAVLWLLALLLVAGGLVVDHKYGGSRMPAGGQSSETMVIPNASSPT